MREWASSPPFLPFLLTHRDLVWRHHSDLVQLVLLPSVHQLYYVAPAHAPIRHSELADDAAVRVVVRIEDEGSEGVGHVVLGGRHALRG